MTGDVIEKYMVGFFGWGEDEAESVFLGGHLSVYIFAFSVSLMPDFITGSTMISQAFQVHCTRKVDLKVVISFITSINF